MYHRHFLHYQEPPRTCPFSNTIIPPHTNTFTFLICSPFFTVTRGTFSCGWASYMFVKARKEKKWKGNIKTFRKSLTLSFFPADEEEMLLGFLVSSYKYILYTRNLVSCPIQLEWQYDHNDIYFPYALPFYLGLWQCYYVAVLK